MRLEACYFGSGIYQEMAEVMEASARRHCPGWAINVQRIDPPHLESVLLKPSYLHNTQKMAHWCEVIERSKDGDEVLLIDSDTLILHDLTPIWSTPFDVAITSKRHTRFPFNSGVVFIRVSDKTRAFAREWRDANVAMLSSKGLHVSWQPKYGGINQASLGMMLEQATLDRLGIMVHEVPCQEWNCEDAHWRHFNENTRIVHYKSALRDALFAPKPAVKKGPAEKLAALKAQLEPANADQRGIRRLVALWREAQARMRDEARNASGVA